MSFCDSILHPHVDQWKWRGVRLMTLGRLSVMSWIHTPESQPKSQLAMPSLHMAVTICLSRKSPDTNTPSLLPRVVTVCIHLLLLMDFIIVYCCFVECPDFSLGESLHVCLGNAAYSFIFIYSSNILFDLSTSQ